MLWRAYGEGKMVAAMRYVMQYNIVFQNLPQGIFRECGMYTPVVMQKARRAFTY
jgi:hypothetical protein